MSDCSSKNSNNFYSNGQILEVLSSLMEDGLEWLSLDFRRPCEKLLRILMADGLHEVHLELFIMERWWRSDCKEP
jgi:hypothetical protein